MSELIPLDELAKQKGIGRITLKRIEDSLGLKYVNELVLFNPEELSERAGIDIERAERILRIARRLVRPVKALQASHITEYGKEVLTTGVKGIDELLGGGLRTSELYEFAGEFGSGKTRLCHQLAVTVQLPVNRGGLGGSAVYIDTEGTFSSERIVHIAERFSVKEPLESILYFRPINVVELEDFVVEELNALIRDKGVRLIVIDSIIALYRSQFKGIEWLARRQQRINYVLDWLKRLSTLYDVVVVYTNQVLTQPVPFGVAIKIPAGGNILAHAATHRFFLRKTRGHIIMEVLDSPRLPYKATALFVIKNDGLHDYEG